MPLGIRLLSEARGNRKLVGRMAPRALVATSESKHARVSGAAVNLAPHTMHQEHTHIYFFLLSRSPISFTYARATTCPSKTFRVGPVEARSPYQPAPRSVPGVASLVLPGEDWAFFSLFLEACSLDL